MLCFECGAEMRLVEVAKDNTMPVAGFEHRTWQCSACAAVERRMTFTRENPGKTEPVEPTPPALLRPAQAGQAAPIPTAPVEPTQTQPIEPAETIALEPRQTGPVKPTQTAPNEAVQGKPAEQVQTDGEKSTETVSMKPTVTAMASQSRTIRRMHPATPGIAPQIDARTRALEEKVRNFSERVAAARTAADDTKRRAQFKRNRDNELRPMTSASEPPKAGSHIKTANPMKLDEPVLSPAEPIRFPGPKSADETHASSVRISADDPIPSPAPISAEEPLTSPAPISAGEPIAPVSYTPALTKVRMTLGGLVRASAPKGFSKAL